MYRTYFFALMLFAMSCTNSTSKVGEDQQSSQQIEYVMNDSLSTDFYTDMKSYVPAEGFIPTADIAVKIAECVLLEIYGKESIEKEKPFSVNLYKEYTSLKSRELEELPRFVVMIWQPFMLLRSASLCLFRITLCMQRYDFVSYKTKVS